MDKVAIVIPTLNEEASIGKVIDRIPSAELLNDGFEITAYVVDGQSTDRTKDVAKRKGARIIVEEQRGKGSAIQTAFKAIDADYVIMVDGDNTYPIDRAGEMLRLLQTHDVVVGSRLKGVIVPGAMTRLNRVGNVLLTWLARLLYGTQISDVCTGLWGYRNAVIKSLDLAARGFEIEANIFAECALKGFRIAEIPIMYGAREDQPKLASVRDGLRIAAFLVRKWLFKSPTRASQG
jgi:dolichol-phosphate hexosyltransferase